MTREPFWEETYRSDGAPDTFSGGHPSEFLVEALEKHFSGTTVLDLGCGEGRNSLYTAGAGYAVTAIDISRAGIDKLQKLAAQQGLTLHASVCDMRQFAFERSYDLILSTGCLHLLPRPDWQILLRNIRQHTSPGGLNVLDVFTDVLPLPDDLKPFAQGLFTEGELFTWYEDWQILQQDSRIFEDQHKGGLRHRHASNRIIARKPQ